MGCKTIGRFVYDNATAESVEANGSIPYSDITTSSNCISCDGTNITIKHAGAYLIVANFTFFPADAGTQETQMYRNGNAVPGAHAISPATASTPLAQSINAFITVPCQMPMATLNFRSVSATAVRISNVIVVKVA
jgi:hypothetical protein